jgi:hypothetical protein
VPIDRDLVNELYDRGCDLVEAAAAIRRTSRSAETAYAAPAMLGCIEFALAALGEAAIALGVAADTATAQAATQGQDRDEARIRRMHRGFAKLEDGLHDTSRLAAAARALTAGALDQAGITRANASAPA